MSFTYQVGEDPQEWSSREKDDTLHETRNDVTFETRLYWDSEAPPPSCIRVEIRGEGLGGKEYDLGGRRVPSLV